MQLNDSGIRRRLARLSLAVLSASYVAAPGAAAAQNFDPYGYDDEDNNIFGPGIGYSQLDAALLVYAEQGDRVAAVEPTANLTIHAADGRQLSLNLVADAVSGATPNGAVPATVSQNFVTPLRPAGSSVTVTSASGGSTVIQLPPTPGQIAAAALGRQYTVPANTLPEDRGFRDHRGAIDIGWAQPLLGITEVGFNWGFSREEDYQATTASAHVSQNFNSNNTTATLSVNLESDTSSPYGGVPTPLTGMSGEWKSPSSRSKTQFGFVLGLTQVMTRRWLTEINYSFDRQNGYQNDPYRVVSVVDPTSGEPTATLYENRPGHRQSQSVFLDNKLDLAPFVTDLGLRYYTDDWGIHSLTAELSERISLGKSWYLEPSARWYQQTAADFFHYYLVGGQPLPGYASSDSRLGAFHATTFGSKLGYYLSPRSEIYVKGEYYSQFGNGHPADAIGQLRNQNLFAGIKATILFMGYTYDFH